jgi:hypothetical protein
MGEIYPPQIHLERFVGAGVLRLIPLRGTRPRSSDSETWDDLPRHAKAGLDTPGIEAHTQPITETRFPKGHQQWQLKQSR